MNIKRDYMKNGDIVPRPNDTWQQWLADKTFFRTGAHATARRGGNTENQKDDETHLSWNGDNGKVLFYSFSPPCPPDGRTHQPFKSKGK